MSKALSRREKAELVARLCFAAFNEFQNDAEEAKKFISGIVAAEGIFRVPSKLTGLISKKALEKKKQNSKYIPTKEHYFGRQAAADKIFEQIKKQKSFNRVVNIILSRSRVHYTTSEENEALKAYPLLSWREAYASVGIELVPHVTTKQISIGEKIFKSVSEVSEHFNVDKQVVYNRINSRSKKWVDWKYVEKN